MEVGTMELVKMLEVEMDGVALGDGTAEVLATKELLMMLEVTGGVMTGTNEEVGNLVVDTTRTVEVTGTNVEAGTPVDDATGEVEEVGTPVEDATGIVEVTGTNVEVKTREDDTTGAVEVTGANVEVETGAVEVTDTNVEVDTLAVAGVETNGAVEMKLVKKGVELMVTIDEHKIGEGVETL